MRFYGLSDAEIESMPHNRRYGLIQNIDVLTAKESLRFIKDISAVFDPDARKAHLMDLVQRAFWDDEKTLGEWLDSITRV